MNQKELIRESLKEAKIQWKELTEYHWVIHGLNYWPTKDKWSTPSGEMRLGLRNLIDYLSYKTDEIHKLSVEQMFNIAKKVSPMNLEAVCKDLHRNIYGG